jgi:predicted dehydrogenase
MADNKIFNVGVVGYGLSAKVFHIPFINLTQGLRLHSIVQRTPKDGNSAPQDHPNLKHYNDTSKLLADAEVDVIVVTTPPDNHFELTKAALEAGKHVLTEKPFVPTSAEADKLVDISRKAGRLICVYQNRRWDSDFLTAKGLIESGKLGRIIEYNSHFDRYRANAPTTWKGSLTIAQGGSALFDLGTHLIDQAFTLFGPPQFVRGRLTNQRTGASDFENPDSIFAELLYEDGKRVNLRNSVLSVELHQPRFWIRGSKGTFHKRNLDKQEPQLQQGLKPTDAGFGKDSPEDLQLIVVGDDGKFQEEKIPEEAPATYLAFYSGFAKALASGKEEDVPVKATDAADVLRIIEAVVESAKTGKDVAF